MIKHDYYLWLKFWAKYKTIQYQNILKVVLYPLSKYERPWFLLREHEQACVFIFRQVINLNLKWLRESTAQSSFHTLGTFCKQQPLLMLLIQRTHTKTHAYTPHVSSQRCKHACCGKTFQTSCQMSHESLNSWKSYHNRSRDFLKQNFYHPDNM